MRILLVGSGKLAQELERTLPALGHATNRWTAAAPEDPTSLPEVVVHAGSGRELADVLAYCERLALPLVDLATGTELPDATRAFPIVRCANTNVLMLKFMCMLRRAGELFEGTSVRLLESHQSGKQSVPGTAVALAGALRLDPGAIVSVRDPESQRTLGIPAEHLGRHALHVVTIEEGGVRIAMETRVVGDSAYAAGLDRIVRAVLARPLACRTHDVLEFVENGWI